MAGHRGVFLYDHSMMFDGGWRILTGQRPFVDFFSSFGPVSYWVQALSQLAFGMEFRSMVIPAALFNLAATGIAFAILRRWQAEETGLCLAGALLVASSFQAAFGTIFMENTAFFFLAVALWLLVCFHTSAWAGWAAGLAGFAAVIAFFAKQNAAGLFVPVLAWVCLVSGGWKRFLHFLSGVLAGAIAFGVWILAATDPSLFWRHFWELPSAVGRGRITLGDKLIKALLFSGYPVLSKFLEQFILLSSIPFLLLAWAQRGTQTGSMFLRAATLPLALVFYHALFELSSDQDPENCLPFLGISYGLACGAWLSLVRIPQASALGLAPAAPWLRAVFVAAAILVSAKNASFALSRGAQQFPGGTVFPEEMRIPGMKGVRWGVPTPVGESNLSAAQFEALTGFLRERKKPFFVFSDSTILYGLTGQPAIGPLLFPLRNYMFTSTDIPRIDRLYVESMQRNGVQYVILETDGSPARIHVWKDFPELRRMIESQFATHSKIGLYEILQRKP